MEPSPLSAPARPNESPSTELVAAASPVVLLSPLGACCVCLAGAVTHFALPCGHVSYCGPCAERLGECAICRHAPVSFRPLRVTQGPELVASPPQDDPAAVASAPTSLRRRVLDLLGVPRSRELTDDEDGSLFAVCGELDAWPADADLGQLLRRDCPQDGTCLCFGVIGGYDWRAATRVFHFFVDGTGRLELREDDGAMCRLLDLLGGHRANAADRDLYEHTMRQRGYGDSMRRAAIRWARLCEDPEFCWPKVAGEPWDVLRVAEDGERGPGHGAARGTQDDFGNTIASQTATFVVLEELENTHEGSLALWRVRNGRLAVDFWSVAHDVCASEFGLPRFVTVPAASLSADKPAPRCSYVGDIFNASAAYFPTTFHAPPSMDSRIAKIIYGAPSSRPETTAPFAFHGRNCHRGPTVGGGRAFIAKHGADAWDFRVDSAGAVTAAKVARPPLGHEAPSAVIETGRATQEILA